MASVRPSAPEVPLETWRSLLDAAIAFRAVQPWEWLHDQDVFALVDEAQRPWFPSVLGAAGQVFGVALYRGEAGLRFLLETVPTLEACPRDAAFMQDALLMDWGAKKSLQPEDLAVLARLGHVPLPRERKAWPCFRSHCPGWFPWFLEQAEAVALTAGLRATVACAELARSQQDFFSPCEAADDLLPTVQMRDALAGPLRPAQVEWRHWQLPTPVTPATPSTPDSWAALKTLPLATGREMQFDVFHLIAPVADGARPYFPRIALMVDGHTGFIHAMEMAPPDRFWGDLVTATWTKALLGAGTRPEFVSVAREEWFLALQPLAAAAGMRLLLQDDLPFVAEARESLERFHPGGRL